MNGDFDAMLDFTLVHSSARGDRERDLPGSSMMSGYPRRHTYIALLYLLLNLLSCYQYQHLPKLAPKPRSTQPTDRTTTHDQQLRNHNSQSDISSLKTHHDVHTRLRMAYQLRQHAVYHWQIRSSDRRNITTLLWYQRHAQLSQSSARGLHQL